MKRFNLEMNKYTLTNQDTIYNLGVGLHEKILSLTRQFELKVQIVLTARLIINFE